MDTKNFINNQNNCDNNSVVINSSPIGGGQEGAPVHVQLGGQAYYDEHTEVHVGGKRHRQFFMFTPDPSTSSGQVQVGIVQKFRGLGMAQQMADGTFDFVRKPQLKPKSTLIKKLAHGRLSATIDGAIQLTLKVYKTEGLNIKETIIKEAKEAFE